MQKYEFVFASLCLRCDVSQVWYEKESKFWSCWTLFKVLPEIYIKKGITGMFWKHEPDNEPDMTTYCNIFMYVHMLLPSILPTFSNPHLHLSLLLPHPCSPSYLFLLSSSCLPAVIVIGSRSCFDVGFDRFVCGRIHLAWIRKSTGHKMEICLQTFRPALGARERNDKKEKSRVLPSADIHTSTVLKLIKYTADGKTCSRQKNPFGFLIYNWTEIYCCHVAFFSAGWFANFHIPRWNKNLRIKDYLQNATSDIYQ